MKAQGLLNLDTARGSLLGTLIGDSLGLPYEGLSARRGTELLPFPLRQRLFFGRGLPSDDSAQSYFVAKSILECEGSEVEFRRLLAKRLRVWFLSVPPGIGLATIKACVKLCVGFGPSRSGVPSAGNGAAMRSAVVGALYSDNEDGRVQMVAAPALITHTHPLAVQGAQLIALAAAISARNTPEMFDEKARELCPEWRWDVGWAKEGPSGYVVHSVNAVIDLWKQYRDDPVRAVEEAIRLGGDTDSVGAMLGGVLGAAPEVEWPPAWTRILGFPNLKDIEGLGTGKREMIYPRLTAGNALCLPAILLFGIRRLFPPY